MKRKNVGLILVICVGLFTFAVPIIPVNYQEFYPVEVPYEEKIPYVEVETVRDQILFGDDLVLRNFLRVARAISKDVDIIEYEVWGTEFMFFYILTWQQYIEWMKQVDQIFEPTSRPESGPEVYLVKHHIPGHIRLKGTCHAEGAGTYYFVFQDEDDGNRCVFGFDIREVGEKEVIKYRTETVYKTECQRRTVRRWVSLWSARPRRRSTGR